MSTLRLAVPNPSPAIDAALNRIEELDPAYAEGVQRVLKQGSFFLWELLISPTDAARQKLERVAIAWANHGASEARVLEAADELAKLMELVARREA